MVDISVCRRQDQMIFLLVKLVTRISCTWQAFLKTYIDSYPQAFLMVFKLSELAGWSKRIRLSDMKKISFYCGFYGLQCCLKNPVISARTRTFKEWGCSPQQVNTIILGLTPLCNLNLNWFLEGDGNSSTVLCRKCLQWDIFIVPLTLDNRDYFFLIREQNFLPLFYTWRFSTKFKLVNLWCGMRRGLLKLFSLGCRLLHR